MQWLWRMHHNMYGGALLADDMGLGKTIQVVVYLECRMQTRQIGSCLLIVPASVLTVWEEAFKSWTRGTVLDA